MNKFRVMTSIAAATLLSATMASAFAAANGTKVEIKNTCSSNQVGIYTLGTSGNSENCLQDKDGNKVDRISFVGTNSQKTFYVQANCKMAVLVSPADPDFTYSDLSSSVTSYLYTASDNSGTCKLYRGVSLSN